MLTQVLYFWFNNCFSVIQSKKKVEFVLIFPGKSYDLMSYAAHEPDATVFLTSGSETKIGMC